jgi:acyl-coenzyme A thioesterase PaaI-like protein
MNILDIPFNAFMRLKPSPASRAGELVLEPSRDYLNHLGTVHAAAQFALAEACAGEFLLARFPQMAEDCLGVVRNADIKYRKPATGGLHAAAEAGENDLKKTAEAVDRKGRSFLTVRVKVYDERNEVTLQAAFEWYIQKREAGRAAHPSDPPSASAG